MKNERQGSNIVTSALFGRVFNMCSHSSWSIFIFFTTLLAVIISCEYETGNYTKRIAVCRTKAAKLLVPVKVQSTLWVKCVGLFTENYLSSTVLQYFCAIHCFFTPTRITQYWLLLALHCVVPYVALSMSKIFSITSNNSALLVSEDLQLLVAIVIDYLCVQTCSEEECLVISSVF